MSKKELSKVYDFTNVESNWYKKWEDQGCFTPSSDEKETFTIMIPPPNVTGILHIGHILNNTIQDILIRKARMEGKSTLWQPGTDHASIATEAKVTKMLKDKGIDKKEIGREKFLEHSMQWKEEYGGTILKQLRRLGASCDWNRTKFTMDPDYSKAVTKTFIKLYEDGLIYKGKRMVNWDPVGLTALSDEEVIHKETSGKLWHFKYPIKDSKDCLVVATTRPETMLGDTGVAVNPNDTRYKNLIGQKVILPIVGREIPIFADEYVDMEFGTGCVKVTPAHDPNDFEMGQRNNLETINIMNPNASLNDNVPDDYKGLDRYKARKKIIEDLDSLDLLDKIEDYSHQVGHSERTDAVIEPYLSKQWFLKMEELSKPALKAVNEGEIKFHPERWTKTYNHWLENIKDWCISRQLWWGHRIPVWYKGEEIYCGIEPPKESGWTQDEDVLDTWFSSWLWPFATLGWPEKTKELDRHYPTQDLATGPDIIFFWVARMIMAGYYFMGEKPFSNVYFNGIIRDSEGRKMSKSLGNSPDPLDLMDKYGVDAIRVSLLMIAPQGLDILFSEDRIENGRNFMNKLWNASRFVIEMVESSDELKLSEFEQITAIEDRWILSRINQVNRDVDVLLCNFELAEALRQVRDFFWDEYADWYIEIAKIRVRNGDRTPLSVLTYVLDNVLKLLHPFMPFVTEEIWRRIDNLVTNGNEVSADSLMIAHYPVSNELMIDDVAVNQFKGLQDFIRGIRNIRSEKGVKASRWIEAYIVAGQLSSVTEKFSDIIEQLARVEKLYIVDADGSVPTDGVVTSVLDVGQVLVPVAGLFDIEEERERLMQQITSANEGILRVEAKLNNQQFVDKAPEEVVQREKDRLSTERSRLENLERSLEELIGT